MSNLINIIRRPEVTGIIFSRIRCSSLRWMSSSSSPTDDAPPASSKSSFAAAFDQFEEMKKRDIELEEAKKAEFLKPKEEVDVSFMTLLRRCPLMQMGDPEGRIVQGDIIYVVGNDLYVDFGGKFHAVVHRPALNGEAYVRGAQVKLRLLDLEMSSRFLGAVSDVTLMEADAALMGLISSPVKTYSTTSASSPSSSSTGSTSSPSSS